MKTTKHKNYPTMFVKILTNTRTTIKKAIPCPPPAQHIPKKINHPQGKGLGSNEPPPLPSPLTLTLPIINFPPGDVNLFILKYKLTSVSFYLT